MSSETTPYLDQYHEATCNMRRHFILYPEWIEIRLKSQHLDGYERIELSELTPEKEVLSVRPMLPYRLGMFFWAIGFSAWAASLMLPNLISKENTIPTALACWFLAGIVLWMYGWKIEFVRFRNAQGVVRLDVGRSGPDRQQYDAFLDAIVRGIQSQKSIPKQE